MEEIFTFKNVDYDVRNNASLKIGNLKLKSLSTFKSRISNWVTDECPCRMCKNYVAKIGFI